MGIKFDILTDVLFETSTFSKFFTSPEPIKTIHSILKVAHDTDLTLSPTNNGSVLWDALRDGDAIFASINKPKEIQNTKKTLIDTFRSLPIPQNRGRSYNVIKDAINAVFKKTNDGPITSRDFKEITTKFYGKNQSISQLIDDTYPDEAPLKEALLHFVKSIKPGNYILMKRVPQVAEDAYASPDERVFPVRKEDPNDPMKGKKIQNQKYTVYTFDGDALLSQKTFEGNAKHAYRSEFEGWGDRDFYVIKNEQFLRNKQHPFVSSKNIQFVKILPIEQNAVKSFATESLNKFKKLVDNRIASTVGKEVEPLKQKAYSDIESEAPEANVNKSVKEYRDVLAIIRQGMSVIQPVKTFSEFLTKDISVELSDYLIINANIPITTKITPGEWQETNKHDSISDIKYLLNNSAIPTQRAKNIKVRSKVNPSDINTVSMPSFGQDPKSKQYDMWDEDRRRWVPFDPAYVSNFKVDSTRNMAIAFKDIGSYNNFVRRFVLFALRPYTRAPELKAMEDVLNIL